MAKLTLNTIGSRYGSIDALNDNFDAIEQALENTLSLDGTIPNALEADLDLNSNDILNAGEINTDTLRINGVLVEPTTGLTAGAAFQTYEFTAIAGQTTFSVSPATPYNASIVVIVNGLQLSPAEVSVSGTNVITPALTLGDEVVIRRYTAEPVAAPDASEVNFIQAGTGAVTRTSQNKMRDTVSVLDFGAVGDGVTDDAAALSTAGSSGAQSLLLPAGTYKVNSNITINASSVFQTGAILKPASGVTITLAYTFQAPISQIFDLSLGGTVAIARASSPVWAEWWGALGDLTKTNNEIPINQAIDALSVIVGGSYGGKVRLSRGGFYISGVINLPDNIDLVGEGKFFTAIRANSGTWSGTNMIKVASGTSSTFSNQVRDLRLTASNVGSITAVIYAPAWQQKGGTDGVYIENFRTYGIQLDTGYGGATQIMLRRTEIFAAPNAFNGSSCIYADFSNYLVGWYSLMLEQVQCGSALYAFTFTATVSGGATSATLSAAWPYESGAWNVAFSNGLYRLVTLTNGATTATWSGGLSSSATASANAISPFINGVIVKGNVILNVNDYHVENAGNGIVLQTTSRLTGAVVKPDGNNTVQNLINCSSTWTGNIDCSMVKKAGATNYITDSNRAYAIANIEPYDDRLQWPPNPDKAICSGLVTGGATPSFAWQRGSITMTVARQAAGQQRITFSSAFPGYLYYDVVAVSNDVNAPKTQVVNFSNSQFDVYTRTDGNVAADSASFTVKIFARP